MEKRRVLFINQDMEPYLSSENQIGNISRSLPQAILEQGFEIRTFMPKFGCINERRHQLHEVIRLSGMNLIINDSDQPLIIKVASIPQARMQVYFIYNDEYFQRKITLKDEEGKACEDNDERAIFYVRGVFETVKKLGWAPDIIHCNGWMTSLAAIYLKTAYKNDPVFANAKIVHSLYECDKFEGELNKDFASKARFGSIKKDVITLNNPTYTNVINEGLKFVDAVVSLDECEVDAEISKFIEENNIRSVSYSPTEDMAGPIVTLYNELLEEHVEA